MIKLYINCTRLKKTDILLWVFSILFSFSATAQHATGSIKGKVVDSEKAILSSATVYLRRVSDSGLVKAALTNDRGLFAFTKLKPGVYFITVSYTGCITGTLPQASITGTESIDIGTIQLIKGRNLGPLTVSDSQSIFETKPGKVVWNVKRSILSAGNSALDILNSAPGVQIDDNGRINLKGREVTVMFDNRPLSLSPDALTELLRNTPSSSIEQVELISTPGATTSAQGSGGMINIKMIRDKNIGFSIAVTGTYGILDIAQPYVIRDKWNSGFNFDYNEKKIGIFGGYSHNDGPVERLSTIDRSVFDPYIQQVHTSYQNDLNDRANFFRLGMDYNIGPKQVIGALVSGQFSNYDYTKNTTSNIANNGVNDSSIVSHSGTTRRLLTYIASINYKNDLGKLGELSAYADYSVYDRKPVEDISSNYYYPGGGLYKTLVLQNIYPTLYHIYTASVDDDIKLSKTSSLQTELRISYVKTDNTSNFNDLVGGVYKPDPRFTDQYNYTEQTNAAGLSYNAILSKKTNMTMGLRVEQTIDNGVATPLYPPQQFSHSNYIDFFPSFQLTSNVADNDQLTFALGRRITRANYSDLTPFVNYQDLFNYYEGNPNLKPAYTNYIEVTNIFKQKFNVTLQAAVITDVMYNTFLPGNVVKTIVNFGNSYRYDANFTEPLDVTKWWNAYLNLDVSYQHYDNSYAGNSFSVNATDMTLYARQIFSFLNNYKAEVYGLYEIPHSAGIYSVDAIYHFDASVSKSLFKKKGSVKIQVLDVFNSNYSNYHTSYQNLNFNGYLQSSFRTFQINLSYAFGNKGAQAERQHKTSSGEEQSRAGGTN